MATQIGAFDSRRIRLGVVSSGERAFFGALHRIASRIDDNYALAAEALSSTPEKARRSDQALGIAAYRIYDDYASMAKVVGTASHVTSRHPSLWDVQPIYVALCSSC